MIDMPADCLLIPASVDSGGTIHFGGVVCRLLTCLARGQQQRCDRK